MQDHREDRRGLVAFYRKKKVHVNVHCIIAQIIAGGLAAIFANGSLITFLILDILAYWIVLYGLELLIVKENVMQHLIRVSWTNIAATGVFYGAIVVLAGPLLVLGPRLGLFLANLIALVFSRTTQTVLL